MTNFNLTPNKLVAGFRVEALDGSSDTLVFDATSLTFDTSGKVKPVDGEFTWTFGDGFMATGALVQRTFDEPGLYNVRLTVKSDAGETSTAVYKIGVAGDELISYDAATGNFVSHGYGKKQIANAEVEEYKDVGTDKAVILGSTGVQATIDSSGFSDVFGANNFKMGFSLKSSDGADSAGEILRVHGSFVARIDSDGQFVFEMYPVGQSGVYTKTSGLDLNDGRVHDYQITLDPDSGRLVIRVDGEVTDVVHVSGELPEFPRDMTFGSPFVGGVNYQGQLREFSIESYEPDYKVFTGNTDKVKTDVEVDPNFKESTIDDVILDIANLEGNNRVLRDDARVVEKADGTSLIDFDGENDHARLGRLQDVEDSNQLAASIDFAQAKADGSDSRLFWNNKKLGIKIDDDGFLVRAATADEGFKGFRVKDIGLNDTDQHNAIVILDTDADRLQVIIDGVVFLDETDTDFEFDDFGGQQPAWTLSAVHKRFFEGEISDFRVDASADFSEEPLYDPASGLLI